MVYRSISNEERMQWKNIEEFAAPEDKWVIVGNRLFVEVGKFKRGKFYNPDKKEDIEFFVPTHWMPFPRPPKKSE